MPSLTVKHAAENLAAITKKWAKGKRYLGTVSDVTDRVNHGNIDVSVFFRANDITVQMRNVVDVAADDAIYVKEDPIHQGNFVFDGFAKGGGGDGANNDSGDTIPWVQSPGHVSPPGDDLTLTPAAGQDVIIDGVNFTTLIGLQFVLVTASGEVANERVLAVTAPLTLTDGGAGGNITVALPTGAQGQILRREAAAWAVYSAKTDGQVLVGDGTDVVSKQIVCVDNAVVCVDNEVVFL